MPPPPPLAQYNQYNRRVCVFAVVVCVVSVLVYFSFNHTAVHARLLSCVGMMGTAYFVHFAVVWREQFLPVAVWVHDTPTHPQMRRLVLRLYVHVLVHNACYLFLFIFIFC